MITKIKIMIFYGGEGGINVPERLHKKASTELVTRFPNNKTNKQTKNLGNYSQMKNQCYAGRTMSVHFIIYVIP